MKGLKLHCTIIKGLNMNTQTNGVYLTDDGSHSIISEQFKESYHSRHGALKESLHVFINAGLKALTKENLHILEIGLGTGLNAWLSVLENQNLNKTIDYIGIEPYPISMDMAQSLNYPTVLFDQETENNHRNVFLKIHEEAWETPIAINDKFTFTKSKTTLEEFSTEKKFDLVYFDAFAPNAQPELWTDVIFQQLFDLMAPGGMMVTYCAKGTVKRSLKAIGFTVETLEGPPGKREMTRAVKPA